MSPWSTQRKKSKDAGKPWPGLFEGLPNSFGRVRTEPSFGEDEVTFCAWWSREQEKKWRIASGLAFPKLPKGKDPDGSEGLFDALDGDPRTYAKHAKVYAERSVPLDVARKIYALEPLTDTMIARVSSDPDLDLKSVRKEAKEMGYPLATKK